jgi:Flp pilus assembly protein TadD
MALSPEIERFIDERVPPGLPRSARVRKLMDALFGKDGLDIVYGDDETKTAAETFETASGNCLSFTLLFVALARHLDLEAYFQEVGEILSWDRRGDVAVSNRHMFAEVATSEGLIRVDFLPGIEKRYRSVQRIDEQRALAHFYSNLGAEALTENDLDLATEMFTKALETDEALAAVWVNMGVTYRRLGRLELAEACYLRALELDRNEISAISNLAGLYQTTGRERLAGPYLKQLRKHQRQNPFHQFRRGLEAADRGQLRLARRQLKRAIRLLPEDVMFRAELGKVQVRSGRIRRATRSFRKALALSSDAGQRARLEGLIRDTRAGAA